MFASATIFLLPPSYWVLSAPLRHKQTSFDRCPLFNTRKQRSGGSQGAAGGRRAST